MTTKAGGPQMPIDALIAIHGIQRELDMLWFSAELGTERRKVLGEVRELIEFYKISRIMHDRETYGSLKSKGKK